MIEGYIYNICHERSITDAEYILYPSDGNSLNTVNIFEDGKLKLVMKYSQENQQKVASLSESLTRVADELQRTQISDTYPKLIQHSTNADTEVLFQSPVDGTLSHNIIGGVLKKNAQKKS